MNRPNVLFFMVDQLNRKDLGYMGHPVVKTPNLDRLHNDSVHFTRCYVQNAYCLPSRVSYLSSQYLFHHREYGFTGLLEEQTPCMTSHFKENGYYTFHVGKLHVNPYGEKLDFDELVPTLPEDICQATDMSKNYQVYCQRKGYGYPTDQVHGDNVRFPGIKNAADINPSMLGNFGTSEIPAKDSIETYTADNAIEFIGREHDKPFFLNVSFDRPHGPWSPSPEYADFYNPDHIPLPPELDENQLSRMPGHIQKVVKTSGLSIARLGSAGMRKALAYYYALITHIDFEIGRVLSALRDAGLYDDTVVVFCADHGDMAGHKGLFDKYANRIYHDDIIHTPLLIKYPAQEPCGREVDELTEAIDLFPTLCEICSVPADGMPLDGSSLSVLTADGAEGGGGSDAAGGSECRWKKEAFSESYAQKALITKNWKLIYYVNSTEGELYNLQSDPEEYDNLYADPAQLDVLLELKLAIVRKITPPVSEKRQSFIKSLYDNTAAHSVDALEKLFEWDMGIVEGSGFWIVVRDGYRLTYIPFDGTLRFEEKDEANPTNGTTRFYNPSNDKTKLHALADELLDYIFTKIRPISILVGNQEERDLMLQTKGPAII